MTLTSRHVRADDHLPECKGLSEPHGDPRFHYCCSECDPGVTPPWEQDCICDRLRACEQRVLDAARGAIRNREDGEYFPWVQVEIALDAINALRGSGNPHTPPSAEKGEQA